MAIRVVAVPDARRDPPRYAHGFVGAAVLGIDCEPYTGYTRASMQAKSPVATPQEDSIDCPAGQVIQVNPWRDTVEGLRGLGDLTRVDHPAAGWPHVDQTVIVPDDPSPFTDQPAPDGFVLAVNCTPSPEGSGLVFMPGSGGFIPSDQAGRRPAA